MLAVPWQALTSTAQGPAVWRVDPETMSVSLVRIVVGAYRDTLVEVAEGLSEGEMVVGRGAQALYPGRVVMPLEAIIAEDVVAYRERCEKQILPRLPLLAIGIEGVERIARLDGLLEIDVVGEDPDHPVDHGITRWRIGSHMAKFRFGPSRSG